MLWDQMFGLVAAGVTSRQSSRAVAIAGMLEVADIGGGKAEEGQCDDVELL